MFKNIKALLNQDLFNKETKGSETIPEDKVNLHNESLAELKVFTPIAKALNNVELEDKEFAFYVKLKSNLAKGIKEYKDLINSAELLRIAIQAKNSFLTIEQVESRYGSLKQKEYYNFVFELLKAYFEPEKDQDSSNDNSLVKKSNNEFSTSLFNAKIEDKLNELLPKIKTEEGKQALEKYKDSLKVLAQEKELGLKLLFLFKQLELNDFKTIKVISEMVVYLQNQNVNNASAMLELVKKNQETFEQIGKIIGIPEDKNNEQTYSILLQYIALSQKHEKNYVQFSRLVEVLKEWEKFGLTVTKIREEYPANKYKLPPEFTKEIPGFNIYDKYKELITLF